MFVKSFLEECLQKKICLILGFFGNIFIIFIFSVLLLLLFGIFSSSSVINCNCNKVEQKGVLLEQESFKYIIVTSFQIN